MNHSLRQLRDLQEAALDAESAYLIRTRLSRLLLSCARELSAAAGRPKPELPIIVSPLPNKLEWSSQVANVCNRLLVSARRLGDHSEPLDERWQRSWNFISSDLAELLSLLEKVEHRRLNP